MHRKKQRKVNLNLFSSSGNWVTFTLQSCEVSVMEAVYIVTEMNLKQSSRQVVFIPVVRHSSKITKPLKSLREVDENIWMTNLI